VVRTSSGIVEYNLQVEEGNKPRRRDKLMPNGTVRLSKKGGGRRNSNHPGRTSIQTRLEIGADAPNQN
jgi:hypothetical protein